MASISDRQEKCQGSTRNMLIDDNAAVSTVKMATNTNSGNQTPRGSQHMPNPSTKKIQATKISTLPIEELSEFKEEQ